MPPNLEKFRQGLNAVAYCSRRLAAKPDERREIVAEAIPFFYRTTRDLRRMEQIRGLLRDTWKFWIGFGLAGILGGIYVDPVIFVCLPISLVTIVYFAFVRYDEYGQRRK